MFEWVVGAVIVAALFVVLLSYAKGGPPKRSLRLVLTLVGWAILLVLPDTKTRAADLVSTNEHDNIGDESDKRGKVRLDTLWTKRQSITDLRSSQQSKPRAQVPTPQSVDPFAVRVFVPASGFWKIIEAFREKGQGDDAGLRPRAYRELSEAFGKLIEIRKGAEPGTSDQKLAELLEEIQSSKADAGQPSTTVTVNVNIQGEGGAADISNIVQTLGALGALASMVSAYEAIRSRKEIGRKERDEILQAGKGGRLLVSGSETVVAVLAVPSDTRDVLLMGLQGHHKEYVKRFSDPCATGSELEEQNTVARLKVCQALTLVAMHNGGLLRMAWWAEAWRRCGCEAIPVPN